MIAAEFLGAFCGAVFVWLHYLPHWKETSDQSAKLAVFCTAPAIRDPKANLFSEIVGTFMLVFIASAIGKATTGILEPSLIGMVVWAIGLSLGATTGYAINPARILARERPTLCCRLRARADRIGATRGFLSWAHASAACWPRFSSKVFNKKFVTASLLCKRPHLCVLPRSVTAQLVSHQCGNSRSHGAGGGGIKHQRP